MQIKNNFLRALFVCLLFIVFSSCGGGGSKKSTPVTTSTGSWTSNLAASKTGDKTYKSSTKLFVSWTAPSQTVDHYIITATDTVTSTSVTTTATASSTSTTLTALKSATQYNINIQACIDSSCTSTLSDSTTATATTEEEYWQLQGSSSADSFNAMTTIVTDSNTKAYVFRYGSDAPSSLAGKARLYYDALSASSKGINIGITANAVTTSVSSANLFTKSSGVGLYCPESATTLIAAKGGECLATSQAVPLSSSMGSKVRLFFEAIGADGKARIMYLDSQDGYIGEDFNSTTATSCSTSADYSTGGCVPNIIIGVQKDATANSGLSNARQFKIGYPVLDSWTWNGAVGTFMIITAEKTCGTGTSGLAYAVWDGSTWNLEKSGGCPENLVDNAHGPVIVHLGGAKYKLYYEDSSGGMLDKPLKLIYGDGTLTGSSSTVDFKDWEPSAKARNVNFLWPSGNKLSNANESGLGDHVIYMPTEDTNTQFMYMNLGGMDDSSWKSGSIGIGMAVLINP